MALAIPVPQVDQILAKTRVEQQEAGQVVVLKRGMASGYAGVENPLFFKDNTRMLFGDAKDSIDKLVSGLRG